MQNKKSGGAMSTKCYECSNVMNQKTITYHYLESGLPNVYLKDVIEFICEECGTSFVDIPEPVQLHIILAISISNKPMKLTGPEVRFLRKEIGMTGKSFAEYIHIDPVTLSRWENDKGDSNRENSNDQLIRLAFKVIICERLKATIQWLERSIEKSEVVDMKKHRLDIHTDAIRYFSIPNANNLDFHCNE